MDVLRGRSVEVVRKELLIQAPLYNLIRLLMWEAAQAAGKEVRRLSFTGTPHRLRSLGRGLLGAAAWGEHDEARVASMLAWTSKNGVPQRPRRVEPRRRKSRPKNSSDLTKPRAHYRRLGDAACRSIHAIHGCPTLHTRCTLPARA
jgi:hypothetical protein